MMDVAHLDLLEGDLEAEALVEVGVQRVLLHRGFLLLDPFSVLLQDDLHVGILHKQRAGYASLAFCSVKFYFDFSPVLARTESRFSLCNPALFFFLFIQF